MADVDPNTSLWAATVAPHEALPPLDRAVRADVVIIGGGFCGLSTALHIAERHPDRSVVLLEARRVGSGASGRCGGMALHWFHAPHDGPDEDIAREWRITDEGLALFDGLSARHAFPLRVRRGGALDLHAPGPTADEAAARTERLARLGLPVRWLSGSELARHVDARHAAGAMLDPDAFVLHPMDWCLGMREAALRLGVAVYERSPVVKLDVGADVVAHTANGVVRAPTLVLAAGAWTPTLGWFKDGILPLHAHVVATRSFATPWWTLNGFGAGGFSDDAPRLGWASLSPTGHLLLGGGSNEAYGYRFCGRRSWTAPRRGAEAAIHAHFTGWLPFLAGAPIERTWSGVVDLSLDRMPRMGVTGPAANVLYALGFSGHGVTMATLSGRILADLYDGDATRWDGLPFLDRPFRRWPPEPLRWLGYQAATRWTGRSPRSRARA
jgi:glycine/D-amino acid oxidase-like deaminating enzyme